MTKLTCQEVLDQLWEYLDDEARSALSSQIDQHLGHCNCCKVEVDSIRRTISLYRFDGTIVVPIQLSERLKAALQAAYRERSARGD